VKKLIGTLLLITAFNSAALSEPPRRLRRLGQAPAAGPRQRNNASIRDAVLGFYISQFQRITEVNDEVFPKVLPLLREFVENRFDIGARKTRVLNQLRQMTTRGAPDVEIKKLILELDKADADNQANQEKFLGGVDPLLNVAQQARLRLFQATSDQRVRQMLDRIQNSGQAR